MSIYWTQKRIDAFRRVAEKVGGVGNTVMFEEQGGTPLLHRPNCGIGMLCAAGELTVTVDKIMAEAARLLDDGEDKNKALSYAVFLLYDSDLVVQTGFTWQESDQIFHANDGDRIPVDEWLKRMDVKPASDIPLHTQIKCSECDGDINVTLYFIDGVPDAEDLAYWHHESYCSCMSMDAIEERAIHAAIGAPNNAS